MAAPALSFTYKPLFNSTGTVKHQEHRLQPLHKYLNRCTQLYGICYSIHLLLVRNIILSIVLIIAAIYIYLVIAVNDDIRWFHNFSKGARKDSSGNKTKIIFINELVKEYPALHGQTIETEGFLNYEFENVSLCSQSDNSPIRFDFCFWLDILPDPRDQVDTLAIKLRELSGTKVRLKCIIDTTAKGHKGAFLATLRNVENIQPE